MALKQKGSKQFGENAQITTTLNEKKDYEDLIRRLKLLSKTQSTFLKLYLQGKLSNAASIVSQALVKIRHLKKEDSTLHDIEIALANLKLEELDVDYTNSELMLRDELLTLSNAVWNPDALKLPLPNAPTTSGGNDRSASLEAENANLRGLLAEAKGEILAKEKQLTELASKPVMPPAPPSNAANPANDAEINTLKSEINSLKSEIKTLTTKLSEKDSELSSNLSTLSNKDSIITSKETEISSLTAKLNDISVAAAGSAAGVANTQAEVNKLQGEISELNKTIEKIKIESKQALEKQAAEFKDAEEKNLKELEIRHEAEKDELTEAMAAEVEAVEKKYADEGENASKETQKLKLTLSKVSGANKKLFSGLNSMKTKITGMKSIYKIQQNDARKMQDDIISLKAEMKRSLLMTLKDYDGRMDEMKRKYKKEMVERKKLHNMIQELKGNIRVYMRCRPPSDKEIEQHGNDSQCVTFMDQNEVKILSEKGREKTWEFDEVFNLQSTQEQVYAEVSPLITRVNTRALDDLFTKSQLRADEWKDSIMVSILEVYNESIRDLLVPNGGDDKLEIRQGEFGNMVTNLTTVPVSCLNDVEQLMLTADRYRSQAATDMNEHSSRSHMMLQVTMLGENLLSGQTFRGKLNLVDLAGSERINKSGATGQALKEAQNINKSLSSLGDVIQARAMKQAHIPFRNSTLTYLLQDSLSQDSKTLMIVCISPILYNSSESICSLDFAARVRTVELGKANKTSLPAGATKTAAPGASRKSLK
eukprot:gene189-331_t